MDKTEENKIIQRIIAGEINLYQSLVIEYQNPIFRVICSIINNQEDAKELTQDVFVKAYESIRQYNPKYKFFSWIYRIAINRALLFEKRKKKVISVDDIIESEAVEENISATKEMQSRLLLKAVNQLGEKYQSVVQLKYFAGLSYAEIAEMLQVPEKTVKSRLFDARKVLKESLLNERIFDVVV